MHGWSGAKAEQASSATIYSLITASHSSRPATGACAFALWRHRSPCAEGRTPAEAGGATN